MGFGFRHLWQHELRFHADRVEYRLPDGDVAELPLPESVVDAFSNSMETKVYQSEFDGFLLTGSPNSIWQLSAPYSPTLVFSNPRRGLCQLLEIRTATGSIQITYDDRERMTGGRLDDGSALEFELDSQGRLREATLVHDHEKQSIGAYEYDRAGCLVQWTDALGHSARYEFNADRRMTRKIDRNQYAYHYEYDDLGRCIHTYGQDGLYDVRLEFFHEDFFTIATFADSAETEYHYSESGALTKIIDPTGGVTLFELDDSGNVTQQIDPNGDVTSYVYDSAGGNLGRVDASGQWLLPFDLQPHRPNGLAYQLPSSPEGWIAGGESIVSQKQTDVLNTQTVAIAAASSKLKKPSERFIKPEQDFDLLGRAIQQRFTATKKQSVQAYDPNGNLTSRIDEDGSRWSYRYTSWNLLEEERSPIGSSIEYKYNLREAITQVKDGGGTETMYELDACDRLTAVHRGGQLRERYVYNTSGGLVEKYDRNGDCLLKLEPGPYDTHAAIELKDGPRIDFKHDELARVVLASDGTCQLARKYSSTGKLIADTINGRGVERKAPTVNLNRVEILNRFAVEYEQLSNGAVQLSDPTGKKHILRRDTLGRFAIESSNGVKQWMVFDDLGHLQSQYVGGLAEGDWWRTYDYSSAGNLQRVEDSRAGKTEYRYDAAHRLVAQVDDRGREQPFAYDSADNLVVQPGLSGVKVGVANQLERTVDEQFEYNARMHISKRTHIDGTVTEYTYDALDRLTRVQRSNGLDWHAQYDPLGRRIAKHWTAPDGSEHRVEFYWDEHRLAGELVDGKQLRLYVYADDTALTPILMVDYENPKAKPESGRVYHVLHDQRGQPIDVRDTTGKSVWHATPAPYGFVPSIQSAGSYVSIRMPGHFEDFETGLFYNRHRYYDALLGRFIQSDPLGLAGGMNTLAYSVNPLRNVDLQGLTHQAQTSKAASGADGVHASEGAPKQLPPARPEPTPAMKQKILKGEPKPSAPREIRGAHSPRIISDPSFKIESVGPKNADGTRSVRFRKELPDGTMSRPKESTVAPSHWTDDDIVNASSKTASVPPHRTEPDGRTFHRTEVDGVEWEVIREPGGDISSSYPTGGSSASRAVSRPAPGSPAIPLS